MREITFSSFITDYNKQYNCNYKKIRINSFNLYDVITDIYNCENYEVDYDKEVIELYDLEEDLGCSK